MAIFMLVFAILLFVFAAIGLKGRKQNIQAVTEQIDQSGFSATKTITFPDGKLLIDDQSKTWAVTRATSPEFATYDYSDLLEFEVYEDGDSIAKGRAGSALVGGLLFGVAGAMIGGSRSKNIKSTCSTLQVRITVKSIYQSQIVIHLIKSQTMKSSIIYKANIEAAKNIAATLAVIQDAGNEGIIAQSNDSSLKSTADKIKELQQMYEDGLISLSEFDDTKKELLSKM